ncbi:hypothetical protein HMN09_01170700 [Mycena chlorophos]|uniref:Uncharacterized protein n=1 Tax=Mycena chlorophos TaxID=658473 RepID=A0A8H6VZE9_MYCCL|nr:hypothetical protein HMN09_01170700 [Mycena chlorophos]
MLLTRPGDHVCASPLLSTSIFASPFTLIIIPISFNLGASGLHTLPPALARISHSEVVLVELQGALEVDYVKPSERDGKLVGRLGLDDSGVRNTFFLSSRSYSVDRKPERCESATTCSRDASRNWPSRSLCFKFNAVAGEHNSVDDTDVDRDAADSAPSETQTTTGWDAIALIKRKIVFSKRPTPIVGRPNV